MEYINSGGSSEDFFKANNLSNVVVKSNGELATYAAVSQLSELNKRMQVLERNTALTARKMESFNRVDLSVTHDEGVLVRNLDRRKKLNIRRG